MKNTDLLKHQDEFQHTIIIACLVTLTMICSLLYGREADIQTKNNLENYIKTIEPIADPEIIATFSLNDNDYKNPAWLKLKADLSRLSDINNDIRYIYLLKPDQNQLYFLINTEARVKANGQAIPLAAPGEIYRDAPESIWNAITTDSLTITGPYQDKRGSFFSVYAPLHDNYNQTIAVLGVDVDSGLITNKIAKRYVLITIIGILAIAVYAIILALRKKEDITKP